MIIEHGDPITPLYFLITTYYRYTGAESRLSQKRIKRSAAGENNLLLTARGSSLVYFFLVDRAENPMNKE